uniref:C2H2-type domain-containing protein n=1 Tax=Cacopsylla melanoneura TaxID=428564 RepID=A0A8D8YYK3_9HEMI
MIFKGNRQRLSDGFHTTTGCLKLTNGMASSIMFSAMSLETSIGTKRQIPSPDGLNLKKRRKQSKPVRIASTEDSQSGDGHQISGTNPTAGDVIVSGNFSINSDLKIAPLNLSKSSEPIQKDEMQVNLLNNSNPDILYRKQNISPNSNNLEHENNLALNLTSNVNTDKISPLKIFNLEAFCDLCNKEFCNKYFLRTHRANKHRVYESAVESVNSKILNSTKDISSQNNAFVTKSWTGKKNHVNNNVQKGVSKSNNNGINSTMRAFCNICKKEFCNKYFVRRHKAKIHGILDNTSESSSTEEKNSSDFHLQPTENTQDSTNDSEVFEKDDMLKNQWYNQNGLLTCSFCEEELNDSNALLKHLEEVHNNPDGEISLNETILSLQQTQNNKTQEIEFKEVPNIEMNNYIKKEFHVDVSNLNPSFENSNQDTSNVYGHKSKKSLKIKLEDNHKYETLQTTSPLNLVLGNNGTIKNDEKHIGSTWVLQNCILCGEQLDSLYMYQTHIMKCHNISLAPKEHHIEHENKESSPVLLNPKPEKLAESAMNKEKHADDIKTLHKMILKMNYSEKATECDICKYDFKSITYLEHHILRYHRALLETVNILIEESNKDIQDNGREGASTPQDNTQMSSFCDICKKELCNKYFMKTHMQRMHGISIETGTHIGGVMCDICNKELCSKYFLRVHKQNSHGLVDDSIMPRMWVTELLQNNSAPKEKNSQGEELLESIENANQKNYNEVCPKCNKRFRLAKCLKVHLSVEHGETSQESTPPLETQSPQKSNFIFADVIDKSETNSSSLQSKSPSCDPSCSELQNFAPKDPPKSFQSISNILSGKSNVSREYQCSECSFSTSALAYLYVHKRSHNLDVSYCCPVCSLVFESRDALNVHFSLHESIQPVEIYSRLGETCWTATGDGELYPGKFQGVQSLDNEALAILPRVRETLLQAASKLRNPLSFAVPYAQDSFIMQPFFVETSDTNDNVANILSSLVFLPVKEKLSKPVTATLTLTPTK